jgi:hypothetical protein
MRKGEQTVLCVLTREALVEVFGSSDQRQWENLFQANRTVVEAIASEIYDAGEHRTLIQVTSRELDPNSLITSAVSALNHSTACARDRDQRSDQG